MSNDQVVMLATMSIVIAAVAWFDAKSLADLSRTDDRRLRHFDRNTWALIILLSFPIGPMLYWRYAKR